MKASACGSPRERKKALRLRVCCMHVREEFPDLSSFLFNVHVVYMNDAKETSADKALIWRSIGMKLVDMNMSFTVRTGALQPLWPPTAASPPSHQISCRNPAWGLFRLDVQHKKPEKIKILQTIQTCAQIIQNVNVRPPMPLGEAKKENTHTHNLNLPVSFSGASWDLWPLTLTDWQGYMWAGWQAVCFTRQTFGILFTSTHTHTSTELHRLFSKKAGLVMAFSPVYWLPYCDLNITVHKKHRPC